jgi:two-component system C4-dicarboxylate transport response regulator DctD
MTGEPAGHSGATGAHVVLIDDDLDLLAAQTQGLEIAGFTVQAFAAAAAALKAITPQFDGVVLSDVRMPQMDGLTLFRRILDIDADIPVILLTGHGDVPMAVQALKDGAYDFLTKPCPIGELTAALRRASQKRRLVLENRQLRRLHAEHEAGKASLIGDSPLMAHLRETVARIAEADVDILVLGETGVGKETIARLIHRLSQRRSRPLVHLNCASLPEDRFQADLFGVEAGAKLGPYGGAARRTLGRLEKAHRGVLLLEDIEALSPSQQATLLNAIEAGELWPIGASEPRPLDVRVVATSRTDLDDAVRRGAFRADLFYRLSGVTLRVPALRERRGDVLMLFQHLLVGACARLRQPVPPLSAPVHAHLLSHAWPGNVRELENFAERLALGLEDARLPRVEDENGGPGLAERVAAFEAELIREALTLHQGHAQAAMAQLQLPRKTFYDKLARHRIQIADYRARSPKA